MKEIRIAAAAALFISGALMVLSCAKRGEPFVPVRPKPVDSTKVEGAEFGHWTRKESPYFVVDDVVVPKNKTLMIDPGVSVVFVFKGLNLKVEGTLIAEGKPESLITFRPTIGAGIATYPGDWGSLVFNGTSGNRLKCTRILYAMDGIVATNSELSLINSVVVHTQFDAIRLTRTSLDLIDCTIATNGGYGLALNECENPPYPVRIIHCNIGFNQYAGIWAVNSTIFAERSDIKNNGSSGEPSVEAQSAGIHFQGAPGLFPPLFRQCNIELNKPCDIRNLMADGLSVTADSLYWGLRTTEEMNALSNIPDPSNPRPDNCSFNVSIFCDGFDVANAGIVSFCRWREETWPNFSTSQVFSGSKIR